VARKNKQTNNNNKKTTVLIESWFNLIPVWQTGPQCLESMT